MNTPPLSPVAPPTEFHYTNQGGCVQINGVSDQSEFRNTREALRMLGFHDDHEAYLFRVLAAILHLGNVQVGVAYSGGEEVSAISLDDDHMTHAAELLGVDRAQLRLWLTHRLIVTARESLKKPLSPEQVSVGVWCVCVWCGCSPPPTNSVCVWGVWCVWVWCGGGGHYCHTCIYLLPKQSVGY